MLIPHIFVWGSCFWFCIPPPPPPSPPPPALLLPPSSRPPHMRATCSHNLLTHNSTHTPCRQLVITQLSHSTLTQLYSHNLLSHNSTHATCRHTTCSHNLSSHNLLTTCQHTSCPHTTFHHTTCHHTTCPRLFAWQAWHLVTSTFTLRGRRGARGHPTSICVAGVALTALGGLWWRTGFSADAVGAAALCVAGVALGDIEFRFAWQAWHLRHWAGSGGASSSQLVALCVAGVALGDIGFDFAWQAWH